MNTNINARTAEFNCDVEGILEREKELGLSSVRLQQMIAKSDALTATRELLRGDRELPKNTFTFLRQSNRLDLSVEYYVVMEKYRDLFTPTELEVAAFRLRAGD